MKRMLCVKRINSYVMAAVILLAGLVFCGSVGRCEAAEPKEDRITEELEWLRAEAVVPIVVTASRHEQSLMEAPSAIAALTHEEILRSPFSTVVELLQYVAGMDGYIKTYSDMDISARGYAYDDTPKMLVLLDGQPVNVVPHSGMQWPTLPVSLYDIDRIEVLRGPGSAIYGADAFAGVINIFTKEVSRRQNTVSVSYGEKGTAYNTAHLSHRLSDKLGLALTGGFVQTEGKGERQTPADLNAAPNYAIKDWADILLVSYRLDYKDNGVRFLSEGGFTTDREGYNASPGDRSIDRSHKETLFLNNQLRLPVGQDELLIRVGARNLAQQNYRYSNGDYAFKYNIRKGLGLDSDIQYTCNRLSNQTLILGGNISYLTAGRDIANDTPYKYDESDKLAAAYLQDQLRLFDNKVMITGSLRYDKWETLSGVFSPRLAINAYFLDNKANLRLSAGSSFRRPSFDENYYLVTWPQGWFKGAGLTATTQDGAVINGAVLKPERTVSYELGLRYMPEPKAFLDISFFHQKVKDAVGYRVYYSNSSTGELNIGAVNTADEVVINGVELEARRYFTRDLYAFLNFTYQRAEIFREGSSAIWGNAPEYKFSGGVFYSTLVDIDLRARYVSGITYQEVPDLAVGSYYTVDLALSKKLGKSVFMKLAAVDLLNRSRYEYPIYTEINRKVSAMLQYYF